MKRTGSLSLISTYKMSHNLYSGDLRSGQFRVLSIISLWGNMKMLPFGINPPKPPNSFRIMATYPICDNPGAKMIGGQGEVT